MAVMKIKNADGSWSVIEPLGAVKVTEQNLTEAEKAQARDNLGLPVIAAGEGENSLVANDLENNQAISDYSQSFGTQTSAGQKGFYIQAVVKPVEENDLISIYLTNTQHGKNNPVITTIPEEEEFTGDLTGIETNDWISVLFYYDYHYFLQVDSIDGRIIKCKGGLPADFWDLPKDKEERTYRYCIAFPEHMEVGDHDISFASHAEGGETKALGRYSHAEGYLTVAAGGYGHAEGNKTKAGPSAHAEGQNTYALGHESHAEGNNTRAERSGAHAEGLGTIAAGDQSHAEGYYTIARSQTSHAEGFRNIKDNEFTSDNIEKIREAKGLASHIEGQDTTTIGIAAHAEGNATLAFGDYSHSEGNNTDARGSYSHAEGNKTFAKNLGSHAEGSNTQALGQYSHAEGVNSVAQGDRSHAEGDRSSTTFSKTFVDNSNITQTVQGCAEGPISHREGRNTSTKGQSSHAEGEGTIAWGNYSHAEGANTLALGQWSHSEGGQTEARGSYSHAEGLGTKANFDSSHAGGQYTITSAAAQTTIGKYNAEDSDALFIVGNGTSDTDRRNAFVVKKDGTTSVTNATYATYDSTGNKIDTTYLSTSDAENTYLKKNELSSASVNYANRAGYATSADKANEASYASSAISASLATNAEQAAFAENAGAATLANTAEKDLLGNVINEYYLSKEEAENTYLKKGESSGENVSYADSAGYATSAGHATSADSATTATQATKAEKVKAEAETASTEEHFILFGSEEQFASNETITPKIGYIKYNPSTQTLTVSNIEGNAATATSADMATNADHATSADTATTAESATEITITADNSTNKAYTVLFSADGDIEGAKASTGLTYNPGQKRLAAEIIDGNLVGNATTATTAQYTKGVYAATATISQGIATITSGSLTAKTLYLVFYNFGVGLFWYSSGYSGQVINLGKYFIKQIDETFTFYSDPECTTVNTTPSGSLYFRALVENL